jgi:hypothetical protein
MAPYLLRHLFGSPRMIKMLEAMTIAEQERPEVEYSCMVFKKYGRREFRFSPILIGDEDQTFPLEISSPEIGCWHHALDRGSGQSDYSSYVIPISSDFNSFCSRISADHYLLLDIHTHPFAKDDVVLWTHSKGDLLYLRDYTKKYSDAMPGPVFPISLVGRLEDHLEFRIMQQKERYLTDESIDKLCLTDESSSTMHFGWEDWNAELEMDHSPQNMAKLRRKLQDDSAHTPLILKHVEPWYNFGNIRYPHGYQDPKFEGMVLDSFTF